MHDNIASGSESIDFPHLQLAFAKKLPLRMPQQTMLATFWVRATVPDGTFVASNFVQFFVDAGAPPWQQLNLRTVYRLDAHSWSSSEWNGNKASREEAQLAGRARGGPAADFSNGSFR